jgi:DNA-binding XRE family transcriptional regulator
LPRLHFNLDFPSKNLEVFTKKITTEFMDTCLDEIKLTDDILRLIATRFRVNRLKLNITQKNFASKAGMGYDTYRKFEKTGEITLKNLIRCAIALDVHAPLQNLGLLRRGEVDEYFDDDTADFFRMRASSK